MGADSPAKNKCLENFRTKMSAQAQKFEIFEKKALSGCP